jgi:hypothetical protein
VGTHAFLPTPHPSHPWASAIGAWAQASAAEMRLACRAETTFPATTSVPLSVRAAARKRRQPEAPRRGAWKAEVDRTEPVTGRMARLSRPARTTGCRASRTLAAVAHSTVFR